MKQKIIVVDDEKDLAELVCLEIQINNPDKEVFFFDKPKEALDYINENLVQLVVSDVRMPIMDGVSLMTEVHNTLGKEVDFILMSGFSEYTEEEIFSLGAKKYFTKPKELELIADYIKENYS